MRTLLMIMLLTGTGVFAQFNVDAANIGIRYIEYHPAIAYASEKENESSLRMYVDGFEHREGVKISEVYTFPLTPDTFAYFFTLNELDGDQAIKFVSGRLAGGNAEDIERAMGNLLRYPKKLDVYTKALDDGKGGKILLCEKGTK